MDEKHRKIRFLHRSVTDPGTGARQAAQFVISSGTDNRFSRLFAKELPPVHFPSPSLRVPRIPGQIGRTSPDDGS